jgi:hypothetical protein
VWNFQVHTLDKQHSWDFTVDTDTNQIWTRFDWVARGSIPRVPAAGDRGAEAIGRRDCLARREKCARGRCRRNEDDE